MIDNEIQTKLHLIDEQINTQKYIYECLINTEAALKDMWCSSSLYREREIFDKIHELQAAKTRLITGEKLPEIVYVDKEIPKYITTKETHIHKSGLASGFAGFSLVVYIALAFAYRFGVFHIVIP